MRREIIPTTPKFRRIMHGAYGTNWTKPVGAFTLLIGSNMLLHIIADDGQHTGWEHVSVSVQVFHIKGGWTLSTRLPTWNEMCQVKELFWLPDECVIQFHPPHAEYVDNAPVLHLWRPLTGNPQTPPQLLVGIPGATQKEAQAVAERIG